MCFRNNTVGTNAIVADTTTKNNFFCNQEGTGDDDYTKYYYGDLTAAIAAGTNPAQCPANPVGKVKPCKQLSYEDFLNIEQGCPCPDKPACGNTNQ